ncbi:uncharacterized protein LOC116348665 [Contarinia nasturtii]|uniref:uncharacterized protein LOC116348665 n=1 Tax=Contarinia nasturtii TaxID=265458 RepID=UPI0012D447D7|nr:uncharacterized protein LOC116348665 [Contarinia nasturtii]
MKQFLLIGAVLSVAVFVYGIPSGQIAGDIHFPVTDAQFQCGLKAVSDLVSNHTELNSWGQTMKMAAQAMAESAQKCASLSGDEQKQCYAALSAGTKQMFNQMVTKLPENLRAQFTQDFYQCFE